MTSPDPTAQIAVLGVEPTYSARDAALLLGRSYSWLDQRVRAGQFMLPDGTPVQPRRTSGGYRRFTLAMLEDIALSSYRHGWFSMADALGAGVGKTWKKGDFEKLLGDVTSRVFDVYGDSTVVYPGHGDDTTLGTERPNLAEWKERGW
jgi:hypothetical protein